MTFKAAGLSIVVVLFFHGIGLIFDLYGLLPWYDIPMHFGGGFAMGLLGLAIWSEGVEDVRFKGWFQKHLKWWLVPGVVLGFVSLISILWEVHEWILDVFLPSADHLRQANVSDTMADFVFDLLGGILALALFWRR